MEKKYLGFASIVGVIFISIYFLLIAFIDYDKIYKEFVDGTKADINALKSNNVKIIKFPVPRIIIDEIMQEGKLELNNIEIDFSFASLIKFNPQISSVRVKRASLYLDHDDVNIIRHDEFISELISKNILSVTASIDEFKLIESDRDVPLVINNFKFSGGKNTEFTGTSNLLGDIRGSFLKSNDLITFTLESTDKKNNFKITEDYKNGILESGKINVKTSNLVNRLVKFIPSFSNTADDYFNNGEVGISCDIKPLPYGFSFENIAINSSYLQGGGSVTLSKDAINASIVKINFDKINLADDSAGVDGAPYENDLFFAGNKINLDNKKLSIDLFIKNLKISQDNIIENISFKAATKDDALVVEGFSGSMKDSGAFNLSGLVTKNLFRSVFNGRIDLVHKDLNDFVEYFGDKNMKTGSKIPFELSSNLKLSSVDLSFQDMNIKTGDTKISGNFSTKFIGNYPRSNASLKFTNLDIDQKSFPLFPQAVEYLKTLNVGMKEESYLSKFITIRKIKSIGSFDFAFDKLILDKQTYENVNFNVILAPNKASIRQLNIGNGKNRINADLSIETQGVKPSITVVVNDGNIDVDFLSALGMLALKETLLNKYDLSKISASIEGSLKTVNQDNLVLNNVDFALNNDKNLIVVSKFTTDIFGGSLQTSGSMLLSPYSFNFVYSLNSADISELSKLLPANLLNSGGKISASGIWSTNGEQLSELLYNLNVKGTILAQGMTINNFSLDEFIQKITDLKYDTTSFQDDLNKMLLTGSTWVSDFKTELDLAKGVATMQPVIFKTRYTSSLGKATFNLYDFGIDANADFMFYIRKSKAGTMIIDNVPVKLGVKVKGDYFSPQKESDTVELLQLLQQIRVQK